MTSCRSIQALIVDNPVGDAANPAQGRLSGASRVLTRCGCSARRLILSAVLGVIRGYQQWISPGLAPRCRFYPSCSSYAAQAMIVHGLGRGSLLAARRLLRCHPWNPGGLDPVPPPRDAGEHGHTAHSAASPSHRQNTPGA